MDEDFTTPQWLSRRQVAAGEGVCPRTISREVERGRFPAGIRFPNNRLYWHVTAIEEHRRKQRAHFGIEAPAPLGQSRA
jgi:IS30 family transposase